ncbi:MAG: polysaccharide deacetylase family protein [Candidatus Thorarchaeota archaeon]
MRNSVYEGLFKLAAAAGVTYRMFIRSLKNQDTNLLILTYHDVTYDQLKNHLGFLERYFAFTDIDEAANVIRTGRFPSDLTAALTFDDGHKSFYHTVFPIVEETGIPVTSYVTTGIVDSEFWYKRSLARVFVAGKQRLAQKRRDFPRNREEARNLGFIIQPGVTTEQLLELDSHPKITIGAHSVTHPMLVELSYNECKREIFQSKMDLESLLGHEIRHFAYPYGVLSGREMRLVQEAGFISAAGSWDSWVTRKSLPLCFPRKGTGPGGCSLHWFQYRIGK